MQFRSWRIACLALVLVGTLASGAEAQEQTGTITGRATDSSGATLPGVTVSVTSPNLIGGARTAVTNEQGVYRMTLLPGGVYAVKFELVGFGTLSVEQVDLNAGATMTINGKLDVASLQETVTVVSQSPTIDLESSKVAVSGTSRSSMSCRSRSLTGLIQLIPGLYATHSMSAARASAPIGPRAHVRPRRWRRGQLRRHDLGPDLR